MLDLTTITTAAARINKQTKNCNKNAKNLFFNRFVAIKIAVFSSFFSDQVQVCM